MSNHSPISPDPAAPSGRFLSMVDVEQDILLSKATINRMHRIGKFPAKRHLSERRIGWYESDIEAWKASRQAIRQTPNTEK